VVTGIDIGAVLAAEERQPQTFVVCAAHLALVWSSRSRSSRRFGAPGPEVSESAAGGR